MSDSDHSMGYWFLCVGCGAPVGIFPDGCEAMGLPPGTVSHTKPPELAGVPDSVPCELYRSTNAQTFAMLHAGQPEIRPPTSVRPI